MAVTIKQIAELAEVSRGTVDKVLNGRPGVKAETKDRVLRIAKELDYKPNYLGKALVRSKENYPDRRHPHPRVQPLRS